MAKRILIIDDDASARRAFQTALRSQGYEILEADNGATGSQMAIEKDVDLVYLDLRMPSIDGVETLRRIRAVKDDLVVYIVTVFQREFFDELVTARGEGLSFELLRKPLASDQLIAITADILSVDNTGDTRWC
ncbi:response regulator with CheY-like receiver, AAA-type ATPase, and DNA-binding domains [Thioflavicoccus mobilis 8321]|uniref:Response regulator with CheY-like receiver, AAA-type ATPase, and DNA-binding domains n=1 Tax=Thioflavicoccus mobilis 8321 TaxID=765912 RepID=L0GVW2_9GAMM|nr:response regulator [Thioflavicoccus mobilis]AGA90913.1 response regulator with CheY-like receiver, AAA-type ATPase, and DNA-binding domains [Thioflavicoccus mobilis 8321]